MSQPNDITGIIFDYGGTIDSHGDHWSEVIFDQYRIHAPEIPYERFREAYIHGERTLARERIILPCDNFQTLLRKKMAIQAAQLGLDEDTANRIADGCYQTARRAVEDVKPHLERLARRYPLVLVSNFYGNIDEVTRDFGIRHLFRGIVESAVIGIRKPDPRIFKVGCVVLDMEPANVLVVGDSVTKDLRPAESLGCATAYIAGRPWRGDPPADRPDTTIAAIADQLL